MYLNDEEGVVKTNEVRRLTLLLFQSAHFCRPPLSPTSVAGLHTRLPCTRQSLPSLTIRPLPSRLGDCNLCERCSAHRQGCYCDEGSGALTPAPPPSSSSHMTPDQSVLPCPRPQTKKRFHGQCHPSTTPPLLDSASVCSRLTATPRRMSGIVSCASWSGMLSPTDSDSRKRKPRAWLHAEWCIDSRARG